MYFGDTVYFDIYIKPPECVYIRDGPFDIQLGVWDFFEKKVCFPTGEKNKMSSTKLKIKSLFFI